MIEFHSLNQFVLPNPSDTIEWLSKSILEMGFSIGTINYIFCDDDYLLKINIQFLDHNTLTDIISFDYTEEKLLSGDIYISTERVLKNAAIYDTTFIEELHRVLIHGILHFAGFSDSTDEQKAEMREQENYYLSLHEF